MKRWLIRSALVLVGGTALAGQTGCASHAGNGALIGGASGAGLGAIIGHNSHGRTAEGALIGGAVGAIAGGLIGDSQDREDRERDRYADNYRGYDDHHSHRYERRYYDDCPPPRYEYRSVRRGPYGGYSEYREYRY